MKKTILKTLIGTILSLNIVAQETAIEVPKTTIEYNRIELPFDKNSHSITLLNKADIENSPANNITDLLQEVAGIDIRRRGSDGMQADLFIRGGSFEQVLLLIDGMKMDDAQTGHHTMNAIIPLETVERIEIIKGPTARIFGQNAFNGAINIITKKAKNTKLLAQLGYGSYNRFNAEIGGALKLKKSSFQLHYARNQSEGYRYNTDFSNNNFFFKSNFKIKNQNLQILATFSDRKFGANGFYASPKYKDQYEETQTSLVGISSTIKVKKFTLKPKIYWRRNQDNYLFVRHKPEIYENFHISNKIAGQLNTNFRSKLGQTGFGLEVAQTYLSSNNLGERQRTSISVFAEQRFEFFKGKFDLTPGVSLNYFSDFKFYAFPGLDIGYQINQYVKLYANGGYTYRIPSYTELFYKSPTSIGNENLKPEQALSGELGTHLKYKTLRVNINGFVRQAKNVIDYTKANEADPYTAQNIRQILTGGFETSATYQFKWLKQRQKLKAGYTLMYDDVKGLDVPFSSYALNTTRHHFTGSLDFSFLKGVRHSISYKYVERPDGYAYNVWDAQLMLKIKDFTFTGAVNNVFDINYTETSLVPMPGRNIMLKAKYSFPVKGKK